MFRLIRKRDTQALISLGLHIYSHHRDIASFVLCFDHSFCDPHIARSAPPEQVETTLEHFLRYSETLQKLLLSDSNPFNDPSLRKLLAVSPGNAGEMGVAYFVPQGTLLFHEALRLRVHCVDTSEQGIELLSQHLARLTFPVTQHLLKRVHAVHRVTKALTFEPCQHLTIYGYCRRSTCGKYHFDVYDSKAYTLRVRIHMLKILVYHTIWGYESHNKRRPNHG